MTVAHPDRLYPPPRPRLGDLVAGISVAMVAIPQSLAYGDLAGVPAHLGLLAVALPPLAAALVASSPYLQTGPVATTSLLTYGALVTVAEPGSAEYVALAGLLALIVGIVRIAIGLVGAGVISYFISQPVLIGFTTGAAILIVASQIPTALGVAASGGIFAGAGSALADPAAWDVPSLVLAAVVVLIVLGSMRLHPLVPGVVIAIILGMIVSRMSGFSGPTIAEIPTGLPRLSLSVPWSRLDDLLLPGVVIALVGFAEATSISRTFAAQTRTRWDANREFVSQGLANLAAGLSGAFPVGGSFGRSAVNKAAGARTRWAGAVTGLVILAFLPVASVLEPLPRSVLAGIVIAAVSTLIRPDQIVTTFRYSPAQGLIAALTCAMVLILSPRVDEAVLLGIGMGIVVHLIRELRVDVDGRIIGTTLRLSPSGVLFFGSQQTLTEQFLRQLEGNPEATVLEIDLEGVGRIDYTSAAVLRSLADDARAAGLEVRLVNVPRSARRIVDSVWDEHPPGLPEWRELWRRIRHRG